MSYLRGLKPRWYVDSLGWLVSRGAWMDVVNNTAQGGEAFQTGSTIYDPFDHRPGLRCIWDTGGTSTDVMFYVDFNSTIVKTNYVAILSHNLDTAGATVRIQHSTDGSSWTNITIAGVIGSTSAIGVLNYPDTDGSHIFQFDQSYTKRYIQVIVEKTGANFTDDLEIGQVLIGQYFTLDKALDNKLTRGFVFGGNKITTSRGGHRSSLATWLSDGNIYSPFRSQADIEQMQQGGRLIYDGNIVYMDDTELLSSDMAAGDDGDIDTLTKLQNRLGGSHLPCIFTQDSTSTTVGDYMYSRMVKLTEPERVQHRAYNIGLRMEQEF